jgi:uncharacterized protein
MKKKLAKITALPKHGQVVRPPQHRNDGWENLVTLLGTSADKRTHNQLRWEYHDPQFYEQVYSGGGIPARIVDCVPDHALRNWVTWANMKKKSKQERQYARETIEERSLEIDLRGNFSKAWKWGRAYGGACLHIVTDTPDPASPLRRGEKVLALRDLSRWDLRILTTDIEYDFGSPNYGHPRIYYLNVQMGSQYKGYPIHWTRMIRFDGQLVPRRTFILNNYWHDSILNRIYNSIRNYEGSNDAVAAMLHDFNVDIYKMKNLANLVQAGKENIVRNRIEMMNYCKSVINALILDTADEDYENKQRSVEGVADLLRLQANRLVADTDIPHTVLLGESPDGSNATGNSTSQGWYNFLKSEQEHVAKPKLNRLVDVIFGDMDNIRPKFRPIRVLDEKEEAEVRKTVAETDDVYISNGVLDPTEVTQSRFGGDEYSIETELDEEARDSGEISAGTGIPGGEEEEPGPSEQEEGNYPDDKGKNVAGKKPKKASKKDEDLDIDYLADKPADPGMSEFEPHNEVHPVPGAVKKEKTFISQTESLPMRDPRTDPHIKGPGIPNKARTFLPTRGNGVTAPSGFDIEKDTGVEGVPREGLSLDEPADQAKKTAYDTEHTDPGVAATMNEFAKGTLKSGSGQKVTDPKQALAIGYNDEDLGKQMDDLRGEKPETNEKKRAATIIVRRGDAFLMGKRRDNGRWSLPGGHVDDGESHHQGAIRELMEETGYNAKKLKFLGARMVEPQQGKNVHVNIYQHHPDETQKPTWKIDPDKEFNEFRWVSTKEPLPEEIANNLAHPNNVALAHLGLLK